MKSIVALLFETSYRLKNKLLKTFKNYSEINYLGITMLMLVLVGLRRRRRHWIFLVIFLARRLAVTVIPE